MLINEPRTPALKVGTGIRRENVRVALSSTHGALLQRLSPLSLEIAEYVPEQLAGSRSVLRKASKRLH
jgi:hypothetical protein